MAVLDAVQIVSISLTLTFYEAYDTHWTYNQIVLMSMYPI